jgi:hypothetical protein
MARHASVPVPSSAALPAIIKARRLPFFIGLTVARILTIAWFHGLKGARDGFHGAW